MVQSARSGFQNIAEGSVDSGVSKKSELKLTGISVGCQDELAKDFRKYLAGKGLAEWPPDHPALQDLKARKVKSLAEFRVWVRDVWQASDQKLPLDEIAANGALSLLNLSLHLTRRQLAALEKAFREEGGVTERLYRMRKQAREEQRRHGRHGQTLTDTDKHGRFQTDGPGGEAAGGSLADPAASRRAEARAEASVSVRVRPCQSVYVRVSPCVRAPVPAPSPAPAPDTAVALRPWHP